MILSLQRTAPFAESDTDLVRKRWGKWTNFKRSTRDGRGELRGENPGSFPNAETIVLEPLSFPEISVGIASQDLDNPATSYPDHSSQEIVSQKKFVTATAFSGFLTHVQEAPDLKQQQN